MSGVLTRISDICITDNCAVLLVTNILWILLLGGPIIDNRQIDNLQIDNRQIENLQIDNMTNFRQTDNRQIHNRQIDNLTFSKNWLSHSSFMVVLGQV